MRKSVSEEWRVVPEFPKYQITSDGDLRNGETLKRINESLNKKTGVYSYPIRRDDGSSTHRSYWSLIYQAFPELKPKDEGPEWRDIPEFEGYQMHPDGRVRRHKKDRRHFKIKQWGDHYGAFYVFRIDGEKYRRSLEYLMKMVFPEQKEVP